MYEYTDHAYKHHNVHIPIIPQGHNRHSGTKVFCDKIPRKYYYIYSLLIFSPMHEIHFIHDYFLHILDTKL